MFSRLISAASAQLRGLFLIWDSRQEVHPLSCSFWTLPLFKGSAEDGKRAEKRQQWSRRGSVYLIFILWVCFHHSLNLYCSFTDWRKERFQPGEWLFVYFSDSFPTCLRVPCFSLLTLPPSWKDRSTIILVKRSKNMKIINCWPELKIAAGISYSGCISAFI